MQHSLPVLHHLKRVKQGIFIGKTPPLLRRLIFYDVLGEQYRFQASVKSSRTFPFREWSDPNGIRTRVTAVKGRCPGPLDDRVKSRAISELLLLDAR